jgi:hypothetical protein
MSFITYHQPNGQVAVIVPADITLSIQEIAAKDVPVGCQYKIVDSLEIDDLYFDAYEFCQTKGAKLNIDKAKSVHLDKFRGAREPLLEALDIQYMKALESENTELASQIVAKKQALRDVTLIELPDTLEEIKNTWPEILNQNV